MSKSTEHIFSVALKSFVGASGRCATLIKKKIADVYRHAGIGPKPVRSGTTRHAGEGRFAKRGAASGITVGIQRTIRVGRPTVLLEIRQSLPLDGEARRSASCPCTELNVNRLLRCRTAVQARLGQLSLGSVCHRGYRNQHCEYCDCASEFFHDLFYL